MNSIAHSDAIKLVFDVGYFQIVQDVYNSILRQVNPNPHSAPIKETAAQSACYSVVTFRR